MSGDMFAFGIGFGLGALAGAVVSVFAFAIDRIVIQPGEDDEEPFEDER